MLIRLEPQADQPIYFQIAESIAAQIEEGSVSTGERLPAARTLAASLGVNMHTVLKAYSHLESRGLVEMRRGRAGVVVSPGIDVAELTRSLVREAKRSGRTRDEVCALLEEEWE
jgi:GntR family transcriptional regulator